MKVTIPYTRYAIEDYPESFTIDDLGNFCIERDTQSISPEWLFVTTADAWSTIILITGFRKDLKVKMSIVKFSMGKMESTVRKFLKGSSKTIKLLAKEEFLEKFEKLKEIYTKRVDIHSYIW